MSALAIGTTVRILTGAHGGRVGEVIGQDRSAFLVRFEGPILLARPDGPQEIKVLPYGASELEPTS